MNAICKTAARSAAPGLAGLLFGLAAPCVYAQGYTFTTLASFTGSDGAFPQAGLTLSADGSTLYGTATSGGTNGHGTVFSVPVGGGTPTALVSFTVGDGAPPSAGLTLSGGTLYGTTNGGTNDRGTVFSVPVNGGLPTTLVRFTAGSGGSFPDGGLTLIGGTLYGTTDGGGSGAAGTVFSVPTGGGMPTTLFSFTGGSGGGLRVGGLTLGADGRTFYGITNGGGINGNGTVFAAPVAGGSYTTLAAFTGSNGSFPLAGLTLSADGGTLYGTTRNGGTNGHGTVFAVPVGGGVPTDLFSFTAGSDGSSPQSGLTLSADGKTLFGATLSGGANGLGTVFAEPVGGGAPTSLFSFGGASGSMSLSRLTLGADGTLYGTTEFGGANSKGTVFSLTPNAPAAVPEASTTVSFGLLLALGLGGAAIAAWKRNGKKKAADTV